MTSKPRLAVFYHYYYPDDVVSARHYRDFCEELAGRGWDVEVFPCNRGCRDGALKFPLVETKNGVRIRRIWRPPFRQSSRPGRILNALWMLFGWSLIVFRSKKRFPDAIVVGTDPVPAVMVARIIKSFRSSVKIAHWCFDLGLEGAIAEGLLPEKGRLTGAIRRAFQTAYARLDLLVDLGPCMRGRLENYATRARRTTLTPWAIWEPRDKPTADPGERFRLFGDAALGLLYSGNFGLSHSYREILGLARLLSGEKRIRFCFGVRGNGVPELEKAVRPGGANIRMLPFADEANLGLRLAAADIHVVSLKLDRTGIVVPSKFFGSLAAGKPVLFAGPEESSVAQWIREHNIGWVLREDNGEEIAGMLVDLARHPEKIVQYNDRCARVYERLFSKRRIMDAWDRELKNLVYGQSHVNHGG